MHHDDQHANAYAVPSKTGQAVLQRAADASAPAVDIMMVLPLHGNICMLLAWQCCQYQATAAAPYSCSKVTPHNAVKAQGATQTATTAATL
jgi:hypothetical protein